MKRFPAIIFLTAALLLTVFAVLGAGPNQAERPPQPFFQDFLSGAVLLQGYPAPEGTVLVACIDSCDGGFESASYNLNTDGTFRQLEINPASENLVGHTITFYLENEFGRIRAVETRPYIGVFDFYVQDLTFVDPLPLAPLPDPTPKPTPITSLPVAGDPTVALLPKIALMAGAVVVLVGASLLLVSRRLVA